MAKGAYIGVADVARKIKKGYIGVADKARKIKKAYIGVGGKARPCWSGGELAYYGELPSGLQQGVGYLAATSNANYALFGGGEYDNGNGPNAYAYVTAYNSNLTRSTPTSAYAASRLAAARAEDKAVFAGGYSYYTENAVKSVEAYNNNLTKTSATLKHFFAYAAAATADKKAIFFAGQETYNQSVDSNCTCVSSSYGRTLTSGMAASFNGFAVHAGGYSSMNSCFAVTDSLTVTNLPNLSIDRTNGSCATVGNYIIIGGTSQEPANGEAVDVYDKNFTKVANVVGLSHYGAFNAATSLEGYAIFAGGYDLGVKATVDVYDENLTKTTNLSLSKARELHVATSIGNYALFGGGWISNGYPRGSTSVEAFAVL